MIIYDRSALEMLYNACVAENINLEIGICEKKDDHWEYISTEQDLQRNHDYKAILKLSNIGFEIDFVDAQMHVKKTDESLSIKLYRELGQNPVGSIDFPDILELKSRDGVNRKPSEVYRIVYFRPENHIKAEDRHKLFRIRVFASVIPRGHHWHWANQKEISFPALHVPDELDFGDVAVRRSLTKDIELINTGEEDITINGTVLGVDGDFSIKEGLSLPCSVSSGQKVSLKIRFAPSTLGPRQGALTIESTDPVNPAADVRLVGNGVHLFRAEPKELHFVHKFVDPPIPVVPPPFKLINEGITDVRVVDIGIIGEFFSCTPSLPFTVRKRSEHRLEVVFSPPKPKIARNYSGTLTITSTYSENSPIEVPLTGVALPPDP